MYTYICIYTQTHMHVYKHTAYMWESQFLGRLIRSLGSLKRRKRGSGVLEETIGVWNSQEGGKDKCFFSTFLSKDYVTIMYPAWGQFLLPENLLTNPIIFKMYIMGVGLGRSFLLWNSNPFILKCKLWEWV